MTVENVLLTVKQLKVSKSTGLDKIPAKMLKIASDIIAPSLTSFFNLSLPKGIAVDLWKNYRVIPIFSEVFRQFYFHLNENSLFSKFQSSSRPRHSTTSALMQMCEVWFDNMDRTKLSGVVFLDIRKAILIMKSCLRSWNFMEYLEWNLNGSNLILRLGINNVL